VTSPAPLRLAAVVVTHNRLAQLQVTVARLLDGPLDHLVVVDNASDDGTGDWLAGLADPRLDILSSPVNLGGAGGFETGLRRAVAVHDPDWTLLTDDDGRPVPGALAAFRAANLAPWDAVAAAVRYPDGRICAMNRPVLNPFRHPRIFLRVATGGGRAAFHLGDADYRSPGPVAVDGASFVGLFLSRRAMALAGYPQGALFLYADDGLYTLGLTEAGGRLGFLPGLHFEHDCSTFAAGAGRFTPPWKAYYYHRNLLLLYRRAAGWLFWPALLVVVPKGLWQARAQGDRAARRVYLGHLRQALADGLTGRLPPGPAPGRGADP
jgi:GT2 family glycosyltransferase